MLAEDTSGQPARGRALPPWPGPGFGQTAAWPGTGGRRPPAYRAHPEDHPGLGAGVWR